MCGRYTLTADASHIAERFQARFEHADAWQPRYNAAPSQLLPVVRWHDERCIDLLQWGLVPSWADDPRIGHRLINARAETVFEKPSFRAAIRRRRCLVPADGFYEWKKTPRGKQPYRIILEDGGLFAFAGLWEAWHDPQTGEVLETFAIITTHPNDLVATLHNRMPLILHPEHEAAWLDPTTPHDEIGLILSTTFPAEKMRAYPVSPRVNNPRFDDPVLIQPLT